MSSVLTVVITISLVWALLYAGILIHEMGHAVAALLVGWRPYFISVGVGNGRRLCRIGHLRVQVGSNPVSGFARIVGFKPTFFRWRFLIVILGGPAATLLSIGSLAVVAEYLDATNAPNWLVDLTVISMCIELFFLGSSVIPRGGNDGSLILKILRFKSAELASVFRVQIVRYCEVLLGEGQSEQARKLLEDAWRENESSTDMPAIRLWIDMLLSAGRRDEALKEAETLIADTSKSEAPRTAILDSIASIPVFGDYPEFLPIAMRCIDEAIQLDPREITLKGTRGALLIEHGQIEEGIQALEEVKSQSESENDRAICSYYLAYALFKKGDKLGGKEQLRLSLEEYPTCRLAARIRKRMR